jgi:pyruvate dehydrogenase (quinone)
MIDDAKSVAIFGGDGCRDAREEVIQLAEVLKAPVGYSFHGKQGADQAPRGNCAYKHPLE